MPVSAPSENVRTCPAVAPRETIVFCCPRLLPPTFSLAPTIASVYDDPAIQKKYPFATELKEAVSQAKARPVSPVYPQISQAIYNNVNAALSGKVSPQDAMKTADDQINKALATF